MHISLNCDIMISTSRTPGGYEDTVKTLRQLFHRPACRADSRFDRYYTEIARSGVGYPTADEARRDLRDYDRTIRPYGFFR